jgi:hypothetical protein
VSCIQQRHTSPKPTCEGTFLQTWLVKLFKTATFACSRSGKTRVMSLCVLLGDATSAS